jgi:pyrroline-5-carboxylate reductase
LKVAFAGGGNMASALIGGMLQRGFPAADIGVVEILPEGRERLARQFGVSTYDAVAAGCAGADCIVLAVKPQQMKTLASALAPLVGNRLVISIAAGVRRASLSAWLGGTRRIVRVMPNTPALVGAGVTAMYAGPEVDDRERAEAQRIFESVGRALWVPREEDLDAVTAVSGSGPAYVFYFMEAMLEACARLGLDGEAARTLVLETFSGATKLAHAATEPPSVLRERVTSKGGTTEAALRSLGADDVAGHIVKAVAIAAARSRELGDQLASAG